MVVFKSVQELDLDMKHLLYRCTKVTMGKITKHKHTQSQAVVCPCLSMNTRNEPDRSSEMSTNFLTNSGDLTRYDASYF